MDSNKKSKLEEHRKDWEEDLTPEQVKKELDAAYARIDFNKRAEEFSKALDCPRQEDRWRKMYDFLYKWNPAAKEALDLFNEDCDRIKQSQHNFTATSDHMQFGLHFPRILWDALSLVDEEMKNFDSLGADQQKKLHRKLGKVFPRYWMPRV